MATIIVNTLLDENNGIGIGGLSLREAISFANPGDTITFESTLNLGTIILTNGELTIDKSLSIDANNLQITLNAFGNSRIFNIDDNNDNNLNQVTLAGLNLTGGNVKTIGNGGAILNYENLNLINSNIFNNQANGGGGINNSSRQPTVPNTINIVNTTIHNNSANSGGGINNSSSNLNLINTTIAYNSVSSTGAGLRNAFGIVNIDSSTISYNTATIPTKGAGIDSKFGGLVNLSNSIVAANFNNQDIDPNSGFYIRSNGHNLIGNSDPLFFFTNGVNGDLLGTALNPLDPLLGTFENRGGSRPTFNLLATSPALDAGNFSLLPRDDFDLDFNGILNEPIPTDARGLGFDRIVNNIVDIGAFELGVVPPAVPPAVPPIDVAQYLASNLNLIRAFAGLPYNQALREATRHFIQFGFNELRPISTFNPSSYLNSHPDLIVAFGNNLNAATQHFIEFGLNEGRIDTVQYLASNRDLIDFFNNLNYDRVLEAAKTHYNQFGRSEGRPLDIFNETDYLASHPDLISAFGNNTQSIDIALNNAVQQYIEFGFEEQRILDNFDEVRYLASNTDLIPIFGNQRLDVILNAATIHYIQFGFNELRSINSFNPNSYLINNRDLQLIFANDLNAATIHYIEFGFAEGRLT